MKSKLTIFFAAFFVMLQAQTKKYELEYEVSFSESKTSQKKSIDLNDKEKKLVDSLLSAKSITLNIDEFNKEKIKADLENSPENREASSISKFIEENVMMKLNYKDIKNANKQFINCVDGIIDGSPFKITLKTNDDVILDYSGNQFECPKLGDLQKYYIFYKIIKSKKVTILDMFFNDYKLLEVALMNFVK